MSDVKTNQFGGALLFILGEFASAEEEMIEDGGMEVFGEDDQGREGSCEVSINELAQAAADEIKHFKEQLAKANERVAELEKNQPPIENGKNRYGLDVSYFRNIFNRELNRPLDNYKPDELARVLARLSRTADESVMFEPEFSNKFAIEKKIEGVNDFCATLQGYEDVQPIGANYVTSVALHRDSFTEQLRKEQE